MIHFAKKSYTDGNKYSNFIFKNVKFKKEILRKYIKFFIFFFRKINNLETQAKISVLKQRKTIHWLLETLLERP